MKSSAEYPDIEDSNQYFGTFHTIGKSVRLHYYVRIAIVGIIVALVVDFIPALILGPRYARSGGDVAANLTTIPLAALLLMHILIRISVVRFSPEGIWQREKALLPWDRVSRIERRPMRLRFSTVANQRLIIHADAATEAKRVIEVKTGSKTQLIAVPVVLSGSPELADRIVASIEKYSGREFPEAHAAQPTSR